MSAEQGQARMKAAVAGGGGSAGSGAVDAPGVSSEATPPAPAMSESIVADAMKLLEELTEDNVSMVAMLNRVLEGQTATRAELAREIDSVRLDLAGDAAYRALKDLCKELSSPLGALQAMLRDGLFSDPDVVRQHLAALAQAIESVLARMGAEQIRVNVGQEQFNPERHFCMRLVAPEESPFPAAPPRTVVRVFESGYLLAGRLLNPARVEVQSESKAVTTEVER